MTPVIVMYAIMAGHALQHTADIRGTTANVPMDFLGKTVSCNLIIRHFFYSLIIISDKTNMLPYTTIQIQSSI